MTVDLSSKTKETKRKWHNIFQVMAERNCQLESDIHRIHPSEMKRKFKKYSDKGKLRELAISRPTLKEWLNQVTKEERRQ